MMKKALKLILSTVITVCLIWAALPVNAKVSKQEAERLKADLTPIGAERAGNAEGTIPAWDGGLTNIPDNVKSSFVSGEIFPDPFADDKVLFTITAQNMDQYAEKLSEGQKAMLKRYPESFKMNIYPTRRTAAWPQWVYDNIYKNALNAHLSEDKIDLLGAYGGIPFPIPKEGAEVVHNHLCLYQGPDAIEKGLNYVVNPDGKTNQGGATYALARPYYKKGERASWDGKTLRKCLAFYFAPPRRKGEMVLVHNRTRYDGGTAPIWSYMVGQRRIRRAPSIGYDTPNTSWSGLGTYDDSYNFNNKTDRYNWELIGKKELYIPYNCYQFDLTDIDDLATPYHINPKYVRWELHRVWVVKATLKEGMRHCYGTRIMHMDEDTWVNVVEDKYDTRGNLWRTLFLNTIQDYDTMSTISRAFPGYDFQTPSYYISLSWNGLKEVYPRKSFPDEYFTPANMRRLGTR
jgi:hypothetical protein